MSSERLVKNGRKHVVIIGAGAAGMVREYWNVKREKCVLMLMPMPDSLVLPRWLNTRTSLK